MTYSNEPEETVEYKGYEITVTPEKNYTHNVTIHKDGELISEETEDIFQKDQIIQITKYIIDDIDN